jgi:hypothetical protein
LKSARCTRPACRSDICTSKGAKPARSKAAAISAWEFTPCSRRIAIFGRAPVAMKGAAMSSAASKLSATDRPGLATSARPRTLPGALGVVAQAGDLVAGLGPGLQQLGARRAEHQLGVAPEAQLVAVVGLADEVVAEARGAQGSVKRLRSARRIWITAPSSSENSALKSMSLKRPLRESGRLSRPSTSFMYWS